jgi:hypothetical protein
VNHVIPHRNDYCERTSAMKSAAEKQATQEQISDPFLLVSLMIFDVKIGIFLDWEIYSIGNI